VKRIRSGPGRSRQQPRIGAPDPALTPNAGLAAITELCDQLGVIGALDAAVGPVKQRERGFGAGELLTGIAAAQLANSSRNSGMLVARAWTPRRAGNRDTTIQRTWKATSQMSTTSPIASIVTATQVEKWSRGSR